MFAATFPLDLIDLFGHWESYAVFLLIGIAFGAVLEMSGFGDSRKLAAQFYFKEQTVLKVMFSAIVVAMVLIAFATGIGLLDYQQVSINPTYLIPGIIGGLLMGVGFIIGGFCPGTSLVAASTFKLDGLFFVFGVLFGIFIFGETVTLSAIDDFWNSAHTERLTIASWLDVGIGPVVIAIAIMAVIVFWGAEKIEKWANKTTSNAATPAVAKRPRWQFAAAGTLVFGAITVGVIGQPEPVVPQDPIYAEWKQIAATQDTVLANREVYIHPAELLNLMNQDTLPLVMLDIRNESDYANFHLVGAKNVPANTLNKEVGSLKKNSTATVVVVMGNGEASATAAWRELVNTGVIRVYILEDGLNNWIALFGGSKFQNNPSSATTTTDDFWGSDGSSDNTATTDDFWGDGSSDTATTDDFWGDGSSGSNTTSTTETWHFVDGGEDEIHYQFTPPVGDQHTLSNPNPAQHHINYTPKLDLEPPTAAPAPAQPSSGGSCG